eukprot:CAMPEP_0117855916 /NCGR_PEP_ID=MMETSP0950-20121206/928_1 /TAXON_ID=44440 /ORGANISM="Chattonella subsalsa, Strain CCMP2191" /LENGTH=329 /DNA_ID=CAMNT_0005704901 /DNA_START=26 /DNA_END=1016 /DNA_ORIENTATION=+
MYHEKQRYQFCGVHAIKNLLQENYFSKKDFDEICTNLAPGSWVNPHKSLLGTGNYDLNVLMVALQLKDCQIQWHDQRKSVKEINLDSCLGVLINVEEKGYVWTSNHWYAIRKYEDVYYDFNSKLQSPVPLGTASETLDHIQSAEKVGAVQIILVMHRKQIEAGESYYKNQSNEQCSDLQGSQTDEAPVHSDEAEMEELILSMSHLSPKDTKDSQFEFPFPIEKQMTGPSEAGKGVSPISSATDSSPEKGKTHKTPAPLKDFPQDFLNPYLANHLASQLAAHRAEVHHADLQKGPLSLRLKEYYHKDIMNSKNHRKEHLFPETLLVIIPS